MDDTYIHVYGEKFSISSYQLRILLKGARYDKHLIQDGLSAPEKALLKLVDTVEKFNIGNYRKR